MNALPDRRTTTVSAVAGHVLRLGFRAILLVRRPRPIHARGRVLTGSISWLPGATASGISWIDRPLDKPVPVTARLSRSIGLPPALPDILGLAFRVQANAGPADVELSSTGFDVPSRFMLLPYRTASRARFSTLLPYRGTAGPVLIAARTISPAPLPAGGRALDATLAGVPWRLRLFHATPTGKWHPFAELSLRLADDQDDTELRFDAVRRPLPGADTYPWVRAVRQPSYEMVQRRTSADDAAKEPRR